MDYETNRDCKGIKYNPSLGQNTGLQKKLDMACKENASYKITQDDKKLHFKRHKEPGRDHWRLVDV